MAHRGSQEGVLVVSSSANTPSAHFQFTELPHCARYALMGWPTRADLAKRLGVSIVDVSGLHQAHAMIGQLGRLLAR